MRSTLLRPFAQLPVVFARSFVVLLLGVSLGFGPQSRDARAAEPTAEQVEFFEKKVRPLLTDRCQECHGPDLAESGLRVDSLEALLRGGARGPTVLPGDPKNSLLVRAVGHGETLQMPPKKKLPAVQIADLAEWVRQGAPWPNQQLPAAATKTATSGAKPPMTFTAAQREHWALQPLRPERPATLRDNRWSREPLDQHILAGLEEAGLQPARPAERATLLRRLTFDLTGLPPSPASVAEFLADESPDALSRVTDRLLASPRYGEKFGRHWLDLARYADSNGLDENLAYANAFRYRDYVISALNRDKPFDRFVQEQIAGDLLPYANIDEELDGVVATGFLSLGAKMLAEDDPVKMRMDIIDEQIDTVGKCFLGLTLGCARCHDHKFDPVDMHDYYGLAGIFLSTKTMVNYNVVAVWQERPVADQPTRARRDAAQQELQTQRDRLNAFVARETEEWLKTQRPRAADYLASASARLQRQEVLAKAKSFGELPPDQQREVAGLQLIEAENYDRGNVLKDTTNYGAGIGVLVNRGELPNFTEYDLKIERAGPYRLELRYAAAASRPCKVLVNGQLVLREAAGKVTGSWNPDGQKWFIEGLLDLPAGRVTLRLEQPQFFPHIDKLLIAPETIDLLAVQETSPAAAAEPLSPVLIEQWSKYLAKTKDDAGSALAPWHTVVARRDLTTLSDVTAQGVVQRLDAVTAIPLPELTKRYQRTWSDVESRWQALKSSAEGKNAERLPDAADEALRRVLYDPQGPFAASKETEAALTESTRQQIQKQRDEVASLEKALPVLPEAMAVTENKIENSRIHFRGSHLTQGDEVPRRFLRVVAGPESSASIGADHSGRLELAQWLTRPDHPLTPRVIMNRLWLWHFGQALVRSTDNFGLLGEKPTHPALLDKLAQQLIDEQWSLKRMHRRIVLSATYAMSDALDERAVAVDPENRRHWRMPRRRLTAEEIRDAVLAVSGRLTLKMGGTNLPTPNRQYVTSTANVNPAIYDLTCRSVYVPVVRSALYEVFQAFDFADPSVLSGQREATTVAPQALFMMNSKLTAEASRTLAESLLSDSSLTIEARCASLFERILGRPAKPSELQQSMAFLERYRAEALRQKANDNEAALLAWRALCRAVMSANEFVYLD